MSYRNQSDTSGSRLARFIGGPSGQMAFVPSNSSLQGVATTATNQDALIALVASQ